MEYKYKGKKRGTFFVQLDESEAHLAGEKAPSGLAEGERAEKTYRKLKKSTNSAVLSKNAVIQ